MTKAVEAKDIPDYVVERFLVSLINADGGCVVSKYSTDSTGYGQIAWNINGTRHAIHLHRLCWRIFNGDITKGLVVDHKCGVRRCVNLQHLRLLTPGQNIARTNKQDWPLEWSCKRNHPHEARKRKPKGKYMVSVCTICDLQAKQNWRIRNKGK